MNPRNVLMDRRKMNGCSLLTRFLTAKDDRSQNSTKFLKFILQNTENQIVPRHSYVEEVSFEWFHHRISSTDSKVRSTLETQSLTLAMKGLNAG